MVIHDPAVQTDASGGFTQIAIDSATVDLGPGQPDPALLPTSLLVAGLAEAADRYGESIFAYGANSGALAVRHAIADHSETDRCAMLTPECVLLTAGATQALDLLCTRFARAGDAVLVQRATYHLALDLFASRGLEAVPVGQDHCVPTADELENVTLSLRQAGRVIAFCYLVPTFHNPTGRTLTLTERLALLDVACSLGLLLVEDDPYQQLYFQEPPPLSLFALSSGCGVLAVRSLTKVLAPGLRVGWLLGAPAVIGELARDPLFASGGGIAQVPSATALAMMASGELTRHIDRLRDQYRRRRDALLAGLAPARADDAAWQEPAGGFYIWLRLPPTIPVASVERAAAGKGVYVRSSVHSFASAPADAASYIRLSFSMYDEQRLRQAGACLAEAIHECAGAASTTSTMPSGEGPGEEIRL